MQIKCLHTAEPRRSAGGEAEAEAAKRRAAEEAATARRDAAAVAEEARQRAAEDAEATRRRAADEAQHASDHHAGVVSAWRAEVDMSARVALRLAFAAWCEHAAAARVRTARLSRMRDTRVRALLRTALVGRWHRVSVRRALATRAAASLLHRTLRRGWNSVQARAAHRRWALSLLQRACAAYALRGPRRALNTWRATVAARRWNLSLLQRACASFALRGPRRALNTWRATVAARRWNLALVRAACTSFAHRGARNGLNSWKARRAARHRLTAAATAWRNRSSLRAWRKLGATGRQRRKAKLAAASLVHRNLRRGLNGWKATHAVRTRQLGLVRAACGAFALREVRRSLNSWIGLLVSARQLARAAEAWVNQSLLRCWRKLGAMGRQRRRAKRAAASLLHRSLRRGWNGWNEMAEVRRRRLALLRAALAAFTSRGLRKAFNSWRVRRASMRRLERAVVAWTHRVLSCAWRHLAYVASQRRRAKWAARSLIHRQTRAALNTLRHHGGQRRKLKRAAAAFVHRASLKALNAWAYHAGVRRRNLQLARLAFGAFHLRAVRAGLNTWIALCRSLRNAYRGANAWANRSSLRAWRKLSALGQQRRKAKLAAASLVHRSLRHGLNGWIYMAEERRRASPCSAPRRGPLCSVAAVGRSIAGSLLRLDRVRAIRLLSDAGSAWANRAAHAMWRTLAHHGHQRRKAKRAAAALVHRTTRRGWNAWALCAHERRRRLALLGAAASTFQHRGLRAAMNEWMAVTAEHRAAMTRIGRAGEAWRNRSSLRAWRKLGATGRQRRKAKLAAASLVHRNLRRGLNGWKATHAVRTRQLGLVRAACGAFALREVRRSLNSWIGLLVSARQLARAAEAWVNQSLLRCWRKLGAMGRQRRKAKRAAASLLHRNLRRALNGLAFSAVEWLRKLGLVRAALATFANRSMRKALNSWIGLCTARLVATQRLRHAIFIWMHRAAFHALRRLGEARGERLAWRRHVMRPAATHWARTSAHAVFLRWGHRAALWRRGQAIDAIDTSEWRELHILHRGWRVWRMVAAEGHLMTMWQRNGLETAFAKWTAVWVKGSMRKFARAYQRHDGARGRAVRHPRPATVELVRMAAGRRIVAPPTPSAAARESPLYARRPSPERSSQRGDARPSPPVGTTPPSPAHASRLSFDSTPAALLPPPAAVTPTPHQPPHRLGSFSAAPTATPRSIDAPETAASRRARLLLEGPGT